MMLQCRHYYRKGPRKLGRYPELRKTNQLRKLDIKIGPSDYSEGFCYFSLIVRYCLHMNLICWEKSRSASSASFSIFSSSSMSNLIDFVIIRSVALYAMVKYLLVVCDGIL